MSRYSIQYIKLHSSRREIFLRSWKCWRSESDAHKMAVFCFVHYVSSYRNCCGFQRLISRSIVTKINKFFNWIKTCVPKIKSKVQNTDITQSKWTYINNALSSNSSITIMKKMQHDHDLQSITSTALKQSDNFASDLRDHGVGIRFWINQQLINLLTILNCFE